MIWGFDASLTLSARLIEIYIPLNLSGLVS